MCGAGAQASGELKLAKLRKLQSGDISLSKHSRAGAVVQIEPDGDDPQIGYRALPQKSWYGTMPFCIYATQGSTENCPQVLPEMHLYLWWKACKKPELCVITLAKCLMR